MAGKSLHYKVLQPVTSYPPQVPEYEIVLDCIASLHYGALAVINRSKGCFYEEGALFTHVWCSRSCPVPVPPGGCGVGLL